VLGDVGVLLRSADVEWKRSASASEVRNKGGTCSLVVV
jgi:hypothetical protein